MFNGLPQCAPLVRSGAPLDPDNVEWFASDLLCGLVRLRRGINSRRLENSPQSQALSSSLIMKVMVSEPFNIFPV